MRIPHDWLLLLMQVPLAFAFCHYALGYGPWLCVFLTLLTLHPLTWTIPALLALHAMVNAPGTADVTTILLPLVALGVLAWWVRAADALPASANGRPASSAIS